MLILTLVIIVLVPLLLVALVMGKELKIERTIIINKPLSEVFDYLKQVKNQENFSVWVMMDPDMKKEFRGTDGTVGFVYAWDSRKNKNVGAGEQEIKKIVEGKSIEYEIRFSRPMKSIATSSFVLKSIAENQTSVQWNFYGEVNYPMNVMKNMFEKTLGKDLAKGLENLKLVLNQNA